MPFSPQIQPKSRAVEIVAFPNAQILDVTGPLGVFAAANDFARGGYAPYTVRVVARDAEVSSSSGITLLANCLPNPLGPIDTLILAGGRGVYEACQDILLLDWIRSRASAARRVASVCTGAFLLGAAGLLDGRRVVTHWMNCGDLSRQFSEALVEVDPIFIRDGNIWTSAGVMAGVDMSLAMVEEDLGHSVSIAVARDLVMFLRRSGGQAQFSAVLASQSKSQEFSSLHSWMAANVREDLSISKLAKYVGMSARNFARRYLMTEGVTPARTVEKMRVEAAQELLMLSHSSIKRIAQQAGFGSEETMRRSFVRQFNVSPSEFRMRFGQAKNGGK